MIRRSRFYYEEDMPEETKETEEETVVDEDDDDGTMSIDTIDDYADEEEEGDDTYEDDEDYEDADQEESIAPTGGNGAIGVNVSLQTFGMDDSPVQNQFNPKEIERLNVLLASENSAIGEYFQASKETNVDILRRLYSDIGEEERFHSEQLLFAKSQLTGEPYVPRDPEVKREYEELLSLGMDEETAMTTAVDRVGLMSRAEMTTPTETIQTVEFLVDSTEEIQKSMYQEFMITYMEEAINFRMKDRDQAIQTYVEAYTEGLLGTPEYFLEATSNSSEGKAKIVNVSITGCFKFVATIINAIKRLARNLALWMTNQRQHAKNKIAWLKRHSLGDIFRSGLHLYFWIETAQTRDFDFEDAIKYMNRLKMCAEAIGDAAGVQMPKAQLKYSGQVDDNFTVGKNNIDDGIENIRHVSLSKTKLVLDDTTKEKLIARDVFGTQNGTMKDDSSKYNNVFNTYQMILTDFNSVMDSIKKLLENMNKLTGNRDSIYFTNRELFDKLVKDVNYVIKGCQMFINALTHDINALQKGNSDLVQLATEDPTKAAQAEQSGQQTGDESGTPEQQTSAPQTTPPATPTPQNAAKAQTGGNSKEPKAQQTSSSATSAAPPTPASTPSTNPTTPPPPSPEPTAEPTTTPPEPTARGTQMPSRGQFVKSVNNFAAMYNSIRKKGYIVKNASPEEELKTVNESIKALEELINKVNPGDQVLVEYSIIMEAKGIKDEDLEKARTILIGLRKYRDRLRSQIGATNPKAPAQTTPATPPTPVTPSQPTPTAPAPTPAAPTTPKPVTAPTPQPAATPPQQTPASPANPTQQQPQPQDQKQTESNSDWTSLRDEYKNLQEPVRTDIENLPDSDSVSDPSLKKEIDSLNNRYYQEIPSLRDRLLKSMNNIEFKNATNEQKVSFYKQMIDAYKKLYNDLADFYKRYNQSGQKSNQQSTQPTQPTSGQQNTSGYKMADIFAKVQQLRTSGTPIYRVYNATSKKLTFASNPNAPYIMSENNVVLPNQVHDFKKGAITDAVYQCDVDFIYGDAILYPCEADEYGNILKQGTISGIKTEYADPLFGYFK